MRKVKEVIVVEGKSDTQKIQQVVDADTIETNGSAIDENTLALIKKAQDKRGVIVFTDPDFPGEKIRKTIAEVIPEVKHAFITQSNAQAPTKGSLGVEHASNETIKKALEQVRVSVVSEDEVKSDITFSFLNDSKLMNGPDAKVRRQLLGRQLNIGYSNGKQLKKRLDMFGITRSEVEAALEEINEGNDYD